MGNRYITHFTSLDGTISYTFPDTDAEQQVEQSFDVPLSRGVGADYAHDHLGYGVSPRSPKLISIRSTYWQTTAALLQAEVDEAQSECYRIGKGWLYRLDEDGTTYRRCLARITSAPSITYRLDGFFGTSPAGLSFVALSDWQATTATTGSGSLTAYQTFITITNAGNIPVRTGIIFTLTAVTAAGWSNPEIRNMTTGEAISSTRDSARVGDMWRIGDPDYKVGYGLAAMVVGKAGRYVGASAVGAQNYQNDYSLATVTQNFPTLNPGANQIRIQLDGTPNATYAYSFYGSYS